MKRIEHACANNVRILLYSRAACLMQVMGGVVAMHGFLQKFFPHILEKQERYTTSSALYWYGSHLHASGMWNPSSLWLPL